MWNFACTHDPVSAGDWLQWQHQRVGKGHCRLAPASISTTPAHQSLRFASLTKRAPARQVESAGPEYNIFQILFGVSIHDAAALPTPQDFTLSFSCQFV